MKTFCKAHDAEPDGILCTAPKVSSPRRSPAGHQQRRKGALRAAGQSQHFLAERHDPAVLHLGAGTDKAPPQPLERHANLPGIGYSDLIVRRKQGLGKPAIITLNYPADAKLIQPKEDGAKPSG